MPTIDELLQRIEALEKEIKLLRTEVDTINNFIPVIQGKLFPPNDIQKY